MNPEFYSLTCLLLLDIAERTRLNNYAEAERVARIAVAISDEENA